MDKLTFALSIAIFGTTCTLAAKGFLGWEPKGDKPSEDPEKKKLLELIKIEEDKIADKLKQQTNIENSLKQKAELKKQAEQEIQTAATNITNKQKELDTKQKTLADAQQKISATIAEIQKLIGEIAQVREEINKKHNDNKNPQNPAQIQLQIGKYQKKLKFYDEELKLGELEKKTVQQIGEEIKKQNTEKTELDKKLADKQKAENGNLPLFKACREIQFQKSENKRQQEYYITGDIAQCQLQQTKIGEVANLTITLTASKGGSAIKKKKTTPLTIPTPSLSSGKTYRSFQPAGDNEQYEEFNNHTEIQKYIELKFKDTYTYIVCLFVRDDPKIEDDDTPNQSENIRLCHCSSLDELAKDDDAQLSKFPNLYFMLFRDSKKRLYNPHIDTKNCILPVTNGNVLIRQLVDGSSRDRVTCITQNQTIDDSNKIGQLPQSVEKHMNTINAWPYAVLEYINPPKKGEPYRALFITRFLNLYVQNNRRVVTNIKQKLKDEIANDNGLVYDFGIITDNHDYFEVIAASKKQGSNVCRIEGEEQAKKFLKKTTEPIEYIYVKLRSESLASPEINFKDFSIGTQKDVYVQKKGDLDFVDKSGKNFLIERQKEKGCSQI